MWIVKRNELIHHGIKGQQWGVRRFRNEDGSLTPAGRERYLVDAQRKKIAEDVSNSYRLNTGYANPVTGEYLVKNRPGMGDQKLREAHQPLKEGYSAIKNTMKLLNNKKESLYEESMNMLNSDKHIQDEIVNAVVKEVASTEYDDYVSDYYGGVKLNGYYADSISEAMNTTMNRYMSQDMKKKVSEVNSILKETREDIAALVDDIVGDMQSIKIPTLDYSKAQTQNYRNHIERIINAYELPMNVSESPWNYKSVNNYKPSNDDKYAALRASIAKRINAELKK